MTKKILAIALAAMLAVALCVNVFAAEATVSGSFTVTFTDNDYDSAITTGTYTSDEIASIDGYGTQFAELASLIETVAPIDKVTHVDVTVKAGNTDPCWNGAGQKVELIQNERTGTQLAVVDFVDGEAVISADIPAGTTKLVLNPYAFSSTAGEITFDVEVKVIGDFEAAAAPAETEAEAEAPAEAEEAPAETEAPAEAEAEAPAEAPAAEAPAETAKAPATGLALAVIPAVMALAVAAVSKKH